MQVRGYQLCNMPTYPASETCCKALCVHSQVPGLVSLDHPRRRSRAVLVALAVGTDSPSEMETGVSKLPC
jgi:hypothetical protein